jgi:hypothetical protein
LLDHSCGHDRQRVDGFNIKNMNKLYGGNKFKMRDTKIAQEQGYLGPYQHKLSTGDVKKNEISVNRCCPFWMIPADRV